MNPILRNLLTEEFLGRVGPELPSPAMFRVLKSTEEYQKVQSGLVSGLIGRREIEEFLGALLEEVEPGRSFIYTPALSLLAVALKDHSEPLAGEHLEDLASLDMAEIASASRMAEYCLRNRSHPTPNTFGRELRLDTSVQGRGLTFESESWIRAGANSAEVDLSS